VDEGNRSIAAADAGWRHSARLMSMSDSTTLAEIRPVKKTNRTDGRRLRSERTKQLIVEAYLDLLREGNQGATAAQIAKRAGYSVRSLFERFADLHALRVMAADYSLAQSAALAPARHIDGDRQTRIKSHVETRAGTCERSMVLWRMALFFQRGSDELKKRVSIGRERTVARFELMYQPELSMVDDIERRRLLIALEALTDIEVWARMRHVHMLSFDEGCALWNRSIDRMLPPTPLAH
jgi:AcrR family transcriptional regulator